jgi:hypothetical protein
MPSRFDLSLFAFRHKGLEGCGPSQPPFYEILIVLHGADGAAALQLSPALIHSGSCMV